MDTLHAEVAVMFREFTTHGLHEMEQQMWVRYEMSKLEQRVAKATPSAKVATSKRVTKIQKARRDAGLCARCKAPAGGRWFCQACAAKRVAAERAAHAARTAAGVCIKCREQIVPGRRMCAAHLERESKRGKK